MQICLLSARQNQASYVRFALKSSYGITKPKTQEGANSDHFHASASAISILPVEYARAEANEQKQVERVGIKTMMMQCHPCWIGSAGIW